MKICLTLLVKMNTGIKDLLWIPLKWVHSSFFTLGKPLQTCKFLGYDW